MHQGLAISARIENEIATLSLRDIRATTDDPARRCRGNIRYVELPLELRLSFSKDFRAVITGRLVGAFDVTYFWRLKTRRERFRAQRH